MISVTLDSELVEGLRKSEKGISSTINELLKNHAFGDDSREGLEIKKKELEQEINQTQQKLNLVKEKLKNTPKFISRTL